MSDPAGPDAIGPVRGSIATLAGWGGGHGSRLGVAVRCGGRDAPGPASLAEQPPGAASRSPSRPANSRGAARRAELPPPPAAAAASVGMDTSGTYRSRRQSQMTTGVGQGATSSNPMVPVGGGKSMFGRRVRNALKRMSTFVKAGGGDGSGKPERSIFRRGSIAKTEEDSSVKKTYTHEDRRRSIQAAEFLKRNDDAKRRSSLTKPDGLIQKVDSLFENTSRPFKKEEIDVIRKACSVPPQQRDDEVLQHLAYVLNFITFFKQLPQQAVFDLCRDINYIAVKGNPIELFKQGSLGNSVYLILSGKCTVYRAAANQPYDENWKPFRDAYVDPSDTEH